MQGSRRWGAHARLQGLAEDAALPPPRLSRTMQHGGGRCGGDAAQAPHARPGVWHYRLAHLARMSALPAAARSQAGPVEEVLRLSPRTSLTSNEEVPATDVKIGITPDGKPQFVPKKNKVGVHVCLSFWGQSRCAARALPRVGEGGRARP